MTINAPKSATSLNNSSNSSLNNSSNAFHDLVCESLPFDKNLWTGRHEPHESARAVYWYQVVTDYNFCNDEKNSNKEADNDVNSNADNNVDNEDKSNCPQKIGLVGFACDQGVRRNLGRVGAKLAPNYIRKVFAKLPLSPALQSKFATSDNDLIASLSGLVGDAGDVTCHDGAELAENTLEQTQLEYSKKIANTVQQGSLAIGLGGGHAIAYASYLGLWNTLNENSTTTDNTPPPKIGIINFDAHLDLRNAPDATSGTPFKQIAEHNAKNNNQPFHYCAIGISQFSNTAALFDRADELGVTIISDDDCHRQPWDAIARQLDGFISQADMLYVTIDMDAFPAGVVPGVSAPAAKGITLDFVEQCLAYIFATGKVKVADIAEINPTYDIDGRSGKVAARLLGLMIEHHLLKQY